STARCPSGNGRRSSPSSGLLRAPWARPRPTTRRRPERASGAAGLPVNLPKAGQGGRELQMSPEALEAGSMRESLYEQMLELGQRAVPGVADVQPAPHAALAA